jgi:hypothetical protein
MPTTMTAAFKVDTSGLGVTSVTRAIRVEAIDRVDVAVPAADGGTPGSHNVAVQQGGSGQAQLVMITASAYPIDGETPQLTYEVDGSGTVLSLDGPVLLVGGAIEELLGAVQAIAFSNASGADVAVHILVGRDATATP